MLTDYDRPILTVMCEKECAMSSAARLDAAYGDVGESVESPSLDAVGCPSSSTAHSPYTLPEEASTNDRHPLAAARSRSTAVDETLATTAPSGSSTDPLTPERATTQGLHSSALPPY